MYSSCMRSAPGRAFLLSSLLFAGIAALCACDPSASSSDGTEADNDGLSPIVDATATGWERLRSIPPQAGFGIDNSMGLTDVTLQDGQFHLLTSEIRGSQGGDLVDRFHVQFDAAMPEALTVSPVVLKEYYDPYNQGGAGVSTEYRYVFKPGTAEIYQAYTETKQAGGFADTYSGVRTETDAHLWEVRSPGGGDFAGLADLYANGTALIPGADLFAVMFQGGALTRYYGRWSGGGEHHTVSAWPVQLGEFKIYWAMLQDDGLAIGAPDYDPTTPQHSQQVKALVYAPPPESYVPGAVWARAFGNQVVFVNASVDNGVTTLSAYRWTEDATTIETLYNDVKVPAQYGLPSFQNNEARRVLMDENGQLTYFAVQSENGNASGTALVRVDGTGPHTVGAMLPTGHFVVYGPWLIDGKLFAGIGADYTRGVTQLDLVRMK